VYSIIACRK